ncbi:MAG: menaquinone biosynthesis protein [Acidobacteriia bacterium]|nr:menaquinone biosynthesis protein [Terriglobia bacterium]
MCPLKISAISFLNTAPLMWDFNHGVTPEQHCDHDLPPELRADFTVEYTVPSRCAEDLRHGRADIGIIPAITYATIPGLVILPDAAIAAKGAVRSILLVARKPIQQVNTIAADTSSRSSVALAQILCQTLWGRVRQFRDLPPDLDSMLAACDAALLIGDPALRIAREKYFVYDLAEEWRKFTGKPFVFAFWAVRLPALNEVRRSLDVAAVFRNSRDHGIQPENIGQIARQWSPRVGLSEREITSYLTRNVHFFLDAENLEGLELFFRYAVECGVIDQVPSLRFLGMAAPQFVG